MKKFSLTLLACLLFLSPIMVLSEILDDLVYRYGIQHKKFIQVPFSGKTTGHTQGAIKNGEKEGAWVTYHPNGHLKPKGNFETGKADGAWIYNFEIGVMD